MFPPQEIRCGSQFQLFWFAIGPCGLESGAAALLGFERKRCRGARQQAAYANGFTGFIAIAVVAGIDAANGLLDLLVANSDGAPSLLLNTTEGGGHWLKIVLRDETTSNTQAVGARVRIVAQKGAPEWIGEVRTGSGYQSSGPGALHIGLGDTSYVDSFEVRWPDSEVYEQYKVGSVDRLVFITRNE